MENDNIKNKVFVKYTTSGGQTVGRGVMRGIDTQ